MTEQRLVSLFTPTDRRVLAWTVQAYCISETFTIQKATETNEDSTKKDTVISIKHFKKEAPLNLSPEREKGGRIVVYRGYFVRLLAIPKPLRDQLIIELPTLEAFRTGEVSSLRVEYIDFERGDLQVLDSKKHRFFTVPLDSIVAEHIAEYIRREDLHEGILIRSLIKPKQRKLGSKTKGVGLSDTQIERIWAKCCKNANIPDMSPRMGRAYFATKWHFVEHKSLFHLMNILRHDDLQSTEHYLSRIVDYADEKAEFYRGKPSPFSLSCSRSEGCPLSGPDCHCRMFQSQLKEEIKQ